MVRLCSMLSGASVGRFQDWGGEENHLKVHSNVFGLVLAELLGWGHPLKHLLRASARGRGFLTAWWPSSHGE